MSAGIFLPFVVQVLVGERNVVVEGKEKVFLCCIGNAEWQVGERKFE